MSDFEAWVTETLSDRLLAVEVAARHANRIFGSWDAFIASLPARSWVRTESGWTSRARRDNWAAF